MKTKLIIIFSLLLFCFSNSFAVEFPTGYSFIKDTNNLKLFNINYKNSTISLIKNKEGLLYSKGDTQFFYQVPGLKYIFSYTIKDTLLYLGCYDGALIFNLNNFSLIKKITKSNTDSLLSNIILSIDVDSSNHIWVAYGSGGYNHIAKIEDNKVKNYKFDVQNDPMTKSPQIVIDKKNRVWVKCDNKIIVISNDSIKRFESNNSDIMNNENLIQIFYYKHNDEIWATTYNIYQNKNRILKVKNDTLTEVKEFFYYTNPELSRVSENICSNDSGDIIFPLYSPNISLMKFLHYKKDNWSCINLPNPIVFQPPFYQDLNWSIDNNNLLKILVADGEINVDLNIYNTSLDLLKPTNPNNKWQLLQTDSSTNENIIAVFKENSKIIAVSYFGINVWDGNNCSVINENSTTLPTEAFRIRSAIKIDSIIFATTIGGLLQFNINNYNDVKYYNYENSNLKKRWYNNLTVDSKKNIWLTSDSNEIIKFDGDTFYSYAIPDSVPKPKGLSGKNICVDNNDNIYFTASSNIVRFDNNTWKVYSYLNSELSQYGKVRFIYHSKIRNQTIASMLPMGAPPALIVYNPENDKWEIFKNEKDSTEAGRKDVILRDVVEDKFGNMYFSHSPKTDPLVCSDSLLVLDISNNWSKIVIDLKFNSIVRFLFNSFFIDDSLNIIVGGYELGLAKNNIGAITNIESQIEYRGYEGFKINNIFPNPVENNFTIDYFCLPEIYGNFSIKLYNIRGDEIAILKPESNYNQSNGKGKFKLNLKDIPAGYYILNIKIYDENKSAIIIKK